MNDKPDVVSEETVVSLQYVLLVDGDVVDATELTAPIRYIHGYHQIIPALEREMAGLSVGETKEVFIPSMEGYGEYDPAMVAEIHRDQFPTGFVFNLGGQLRIQDGSGNSFNAIIRGIGPEKVTLDLNHPLAGKDLLFQATVADLRYATEEELSSGQIESE